MTWVERYKSIAFDYCKLVGWDFYSPTTNLWEAYHWGCIMLERKHWAYQL